jgi:hypothetical protein
LQLVYRKSPPDLGAPVVNRKATDAALGSNGSLAKAKKDATSDD